MSTFTPAALAQARSHTYRLLARLYGQGLTAETLPYAAAIDALAAWIPTSFDPDQAAADHQQLYGYNVFPFATLFLSPDLLLAGSITEQVSALYVQGTFQPTDQADHLVQELEFLAFLCQAEAGAQSGEAVGQILRLHRLQRHFLDTHLLWWLPLFGQAVQMEGQSFASALATLSVEFVLDHRVDLGDDQTDEIHASPLPQPPAILDDAQTGLKEIGAYLLTPVYSGIYISRDQIGRMARSLGLPRGFGERRQMLTNLLRAAGEYDQFPALQAELQAVVGAFQAGLNKIEMATPGWPPIARIWRDRLAGAMKILHRIDEASS